MNNNRIELKELAPIVLNVYKRPWHTEQTLKALQRNDLADQSTLYIFCDGPKYSALTQDLESIEKVREIAKSVKWCKEVNVIEAQANLGLVRSFVTAITDVVNKHGKVIVLEDDQVTSVGFLRYMNEALTLYENDDRVMHVSGYMYPAEFETSEATFFLNVQSAPGWGTWKRAWALYNHDAVDHYNYFSKSPQLIKEFDLGGHALWFAQLERNTQQPGFSFAVRWYASCFRANGLSLFPARSLVQNIGLDGTGEHVPAGAMYKVEPVDYLDIEKVPIVENKEIRRSIGKFYKKHHRQPLRVQLNTSLRKLRGRVRSFLRQPIVRIYPELKTLDRNRPEYGAMASNLTNSRVSPAAKVNRPHHIWDTSIGDYTYVSHSAWISSTRIGKFCSIGPNFYCGWGIHPVNGISTSPMFYSTQAQNGTTLSLNNKVQERAPINIGNDVFIGMNVTVLDGVTIGDGAVIGAGAVVSKDVPPYAIVVGCPMQILRYRFPEDVIEQLQAIKWWDWPEEQLQQVEQHFFDVESFVAKYGREVS